MYFLNKKYNVNDSNFNNIINLCNKYNIKKYEIHDNLEITIYEDVEILFRYIITIPFKIREVFGSFNCSYNRLKNLMNSPRIIHGDFIFINNNIFNLLYCPNEIGGNMYGYGNRISIFKTFPKHIGGDVDFSSCSLNSLHGCPDTIMGEFNISNNKTLYNLKYGPKYVYGNCIYSRCSLNTLYGSPKYISGTFDCSFNNIKDLKHSPKYIGVNFIFNNNKISTFYDFPEHVGGDIYCKNNPIDIIWSLFKDKTYIDYFNQLKIISGNNIININKLNIFLKTFGNDKVVKSVDWYINK